MSLKPMYEKCFRICIWSLILAFAAVALTIAVSVFFDTAIISIGKLIVDVCLMTALLFFGIAMLLRGTHTLKQSRSGLMHGGEPAFPPPAEQGSGAMPAHHS